MKPTTYPGIDYGKYTNINRNPETGIHYGVISRNSVIDCGQEVFERGDNLSFKAWQDEVKKDIRRALDDYFSDHKFGDRKTSPLDDAVENAFDAIEDGLNDRYQEDSDDYKYEHDGYVITTCLDNDFMVIKSPFYTYAQFCSPCAPGAGNLDSPFKSSVGNPDWSEELKLEAEKAGFKKVYCLGRDWFDGGVSPYPIFSVETNELASKPQV